MYGVAPLPWGAEVKNIFLTYSFCARSSVFALFTNGHVDLVTGSESSTYWSRAVLWKKKKNIKQTVQTLSCGHSVLVQKHQQTVSWHCQSQMQWFCTLCLSCVSCTTSGSTPQARFPPTFPDYFQIPRLCQVFQVDGHPEWWNRDSQTRKAPVKSPPPNTNARLFLQARCPSRRPTNSVNA